MGSTRFDWIRQHFADRRPLHAVKAEATPAATTAGDGLIKDTLFVQTFQAGTVTPKEGDTGRYILTLDAGHGQTIFFSDRPDRVVGAVPTPQFLEGLGFFPDNPPNAALVVETAPGETDIAVVELYSPLYDPITQGVTYEVEVLGNWQAELELDFAEAPTDLVNLAPDFGAAQLFIDDCADAEMQCVHTLTREQIGVISNSTHDGFCYSWSSWMCLPCQPGITDSRLAEKYWIDWCNLTFRACNNLCTVKGFW